jgi:hypothetical protein
MPACSWSWPRDLGQVSDTLAAEHGDTDMRVYRTVDDAIAAIGRASSSDSR